MVVEGVGQDEAAGAHEIEHVAEELAVAVNEVVLIEVVEDDGQRAVEHLGDARRVAEPGQRLQRRGVDEAADVDAHGRVLHGQHGRPGHAHFAAAAAAAGQEQA